MLKEKFKELEKLLFEEIESYYAERLISVVIYGSVARNSQTFDSDLDVLIIVRNLPNGRMKRIKEFDIVEEKIAPFLKSLSEKYGINSYISVVIKSPEEAENGSPLFLDMVEDARILYDRDNFFAKILERIRKRLEELGSKRIWRGNAWYWDLKPDYNPGDIFEI